MYCVINLCDTLGKRKEKNTSGKKEAKNPVYACVYIFSFLGAATLIPVSMAVIIMKTYCYVTIIMKLLV